MGKLIFEQNEELSKNDAVLICRDGSDIKVVLPFTDEEKSPIRQSDVTASQAFFIGYAVRMSVSTVENDMWVEEMMEYITSQLPHDLENLTAEETNDGDTSEDRRANLQSARSDDDEDNVDTK